MNKETNTANQLDKQFKVTVVSNWVGPREHLFNDLGTAQEFALAMRNCQYKTEIEEVNCDE